MYKSTKQFEIAHFHNAERYTYTRQTSVQSKEINFQKSSKQQKKNSLNYRIQHEKILKNFKIVYKLQIDKINKHGIYFLKCKGSIKKTMIVCTITFVRLVPLIWSIIQYL